MAYSFQNKNSNAAVTVGELNQVVNGVEKPYKVYTALLTQSEENAPVATVLENTIGDIVWTRANRGIYVGTLNNSFPENKTVVINSMQNSTVCILISGRETNDTVYFESDNFEQAIELNGQVAIEIRVYN